jgi:hypothetical protein
VKNNFSGTVVKIPRLKNILQEVRTVNVVETSGAITYKIPLGQETANMGHFVSQEIVNGVLTIRFAIKGIVKEEAEIFDLKFN